jgi:hypothetical protein
MIRCFNFLTPVLAGAILFVAPALAQVQSQPLPPPTGTPSAPPAASPPAAPPSSTRTEPSRTPTPTPIGKPASKGKTTAATCPADKVDINDASAETLKTLPQIGKVRSSAIIKARPYAAPEDLLRKKVLKKAVYEKIKPCILASGVAPSATPATPRKTSSTRGNTAPTKSTAARPPVTPVPIPEPSSKPQQ